MGEFEKYLANKDFVFLFLDVRMSFKFYGFTLIFFPPFMTNETKFLFV